MLVLLLIFSILLYIRKNRTLQLTFPELYHVGLQAGDCIYTVVGDVQFSGHLDIVLLTKENSSLHIYYVFHRKSITLPLHYIPAGHHLVCEPEHTYLEGTPFTLRRGLLTLYKKKRRGLGFVNEILHTSNSWPISEITS